MFLEQQTSLLEWFQKDDCATEDSHNLCWKYSFAINYVLKSLLYITIEKSYFEL